jgi:hypothetical protein
MNKIYRLILLSSGLWLLGWQIWSWAGIQDDALIHLRYAENLYRTHQLSYDGIHPNYGASSLLYVRLLAFLSGFTQSPQLPRAVSSIAHMLLALGLAGLILRFIPERATLARLLGLILLLFLVMPSSVRWLDDGMETGLGLCFVVAFCLILFLQSIRPSSTVRSYPGIIVFSFFMVLLRTEYSFLCGIGFAILLYSDLFPQPPRHRPQGLRQWILAVLRAGSPLVGCGLTLLYILARMHVLLPDTALAKSDWYWRNVLGAAEIVLLSALSFGIGLLLFWLTTTVLALWFSRRHLQLLLANSVFPVTLFLAAVRGQEIQGIRYLTWTFVFSILWNTLELGHAAVDRPQERTISRIALYPAYLWIALLIISLPFEVRAISHVLRGRVENMKAFEADRLEVLAGKSGIASDVGYIGYFSRGEICDLSGLVNGRAAARLTYEQRLVSCTAGHPDFLFLAINQVGSVNSHLSIANWSVCTHYDFTNLINLDRHYLLLPNDTAEQTCKQISPSSHPYPASRLLQ